jgi:hypothetical protein
MERSWTELKYLAYNQPSWRKELSWTALNRLAGGDFSNALALIDLVLSLPAATAECERGFGLMKRVKSDWRSALATETLNDLMTVELLSPDIKEFDPTRSIQLWLADSQRRQGIAFVDDISSSDSD